MNKFYSHIAVGILVWGCCFYYWNFHIVKDVPFTSSSSTIDEEGKKIPTESNTSVQEQGKNINISHKDIIKDNNKIYTNINTFTMNKDHFQYNNRFSIGTTYLINTKTVLAELRYDYKDFGISLYAGYSFLIQDYEAGASLHWTFWKF